MKSSSRISRRDLLATTVATAAGSIFTAAEAQTPPPATQRNIDDFFRDFTADWVRHDPDLATSTRYFSGEEQDRLERQLTPLTLAWQRERIDRARKGLAELRTFDRARLTETQRVSADAMEWQLDNMVRGEAYLDFKFPLEQFVGANVQLVELVTVRRSLVSERDAENYIAALGQVAGRMDEATAEASRLASKNIVPPRFILQATIRQMERFADPSPAENPFVIAFMEKLSAIKSIPDSKRVALRSEAAKVVGAEIYRAWKKASGLLESQLARSTDEAGLWRLKSGPEAYAYNLRAFTTTTRTADEIHEIGLKQVARIETEMDTLLRRLDRTDGSVKDRIAKLALDMQYPNPASDESRAQIMRDIDGIIRDAQQRSSALFDITPKSPVVARPYPRFMETNSAASYRGPTADGSRPGTFQYPRRIEYMTRFGLRSVVYHETVPGHHFDGALQVENKDLPRFRQIRAFRGIPARGEGWALYAERLAAESGWYGDDAEGLLGQLNDELFRARRLVVDTGLHSKRWTRQQAIDYGIEASEVERYVVWPGQACSYMIGELKIIELREKARKALGERFSLREFHNTVLRTGLVPLEILERQIDAYIRSAV